MRHSAASPEDWIAGLVASKPEGAFLMLGVDAGWVMAVAAALQPMAKLLVAAEAAADLTAVSELPQREIRAALHVQPFDSFLVDIAQQRFVGLLLPQPLAPTLLHRACDNLLPGGLLLSPRPLLLGEQACHWHHLEAQAGALSLAVKGGVIRRRGAVRASTQAKAVAPSG